MKRREKKARRLIEEQPKRIVSAKVVQGVPVCIVEWADPKRSDRTLYTSKELRYKCPVLLAKFYEQKILESGAVLPSAD